MQPQCFSSISRCLCRYLFVVVLLFLGGCIGIQSVDRGSVTEQLPQQWQQVSGEHPLEMEWWQGFSSPILSELLRQAENNSPDFAIMVERIIQAELQLRISGVSRFPSLNLGGNTSRSYRRADGGSTTSGESTSLSLSAGYEIDLFGRVAAEYEGAKASFRATRFDIAATELSLRSAIASTYFQLLVVRERLIIARENLTITERVLNIVENRLRFGSASQLDFDRQRSTVLNQQSSILSLEEQLRQLTSALGLLVGQSPQRFLLEPEAVAILRIPAVTPYLPSELLLRRPDLARLEAQLQVAEAQVATARGALFPSINLTSSLGVASSALLSLTDPGTSFSMGLGFSQSLFDAGRRRNQVSLSRSRQREVVENYRKGVLVSLKEVEDALDRVYVSALQKRIQDQVVVLAQNNLRRAEHRYLEGADELLNLLDTQRSLFSAQEQQIQFHLARLNAALGLYKALGGGWSMVDVTSY